MTHDSGRRIEDVIVADPTDRQGRAIMIRYLLLGTLAAAVALFVWQTLSNALLPWHTMTLREFTEPDLMIAALGAAAPENGLYYHERGVMTAVSILPGVSDKSTLMGSMLLRQILLDVIAAFVLALAATRLPGEALRTAITFGAVGLGAGIILELAEWNWYGYPLVHVLVNTVDVAISCAIAGLVLGWLSNRLTRSRTVATATRIEAAPA